MALPSLGDLAQAHVLRNQNATLKSDLQRRATEAATWQTARPAERFRGDFGPLAAIKASLARLDGFDTAVADAAVAGNAMSNALNAIDKGVTKLSAALLTAGSAANPALVTTAALSAEEAFQSAVAALNTRVGDRAIFAGTDTGGPAIASAETLLTAVMAAVDASGADDAAAIASAVSDWFAGSDFDTVAYLGGPAGAPLALGGGESVTLDVTAADDDLRGTLAGLATAALVNRGVLADDRAGRAALMQEAGTMLNTAQVSRTEVIARLGLAEGRIEVAKSRNAAERNAMDLAGTEMMAVDPYEAAVALTETETRIEALFTITARLSRLTLVDYL